MAPSSNLRGALFMSISMAGFTANDAIVKDVTQSMSMVQIMLVRGLFATLLIGLLAWWYGALKAPRTIVHPAVVLRIACEIGATLSFLTALSNIPLANASAVLQALPLAVTMGAALFLSEPVGWRRWTAIATGFTGVLIIVRPGFEGFNAYALFAVAAVAFCTVRDLATRQIPHEIPSLFLSTATAGAVTLSGAVLVVPYGGWSPIAAGDIGLLFGAAVLLLFGYQFIILSLREGDISFIAPFRYSALLWAILLGFLAFGDVPDAPMVVGAAIVVGSGLYALYREHWVGRRRPIAETTNAAMAPDGT